MTPESPRTIRFLFDYISPYAWLAWKRVHALADEAGAVVEPVPVLFAGFLKALGHKGPAQVENKRTYAFKDCLRVAAVEGIPFEPPPRHPFNPLLALRVSGLEMAAETRRALIDRLFAEVWGGGRGVVAPDVVAAHCAAVGVHDALARASDPIAKQRLRDATDAAIAAGAFGVPTMLVEGEVFWGFESFPHLRRFLKAGEPFETERLATWMDWLSRYGR